MKKVIAIVLVVLMLLAFAACGNSSQPTPKPDDSGSQNTPSKEDSTTPASDDKKEDTPAPSGDAEPAASDGPQYGGNLRIVSVAEGATPIGVPWNVIGIDVNLCVPFGETLLTEASNGNIGPWLATEWEVNTEEPSVTFTLREGVKFTDGTDFNADVCAWNIAHFIEAGSINPAVLSAEVVGDYKVKVNLSNWTNTILSTFASHSFSMISKEYYEANGEEKAQENPVGTGPFILKEYIHGQSITFVKNENYWQEGKPYLDSVTYIFMSDTMTQNAAMQIDGDDGVDVLNTTNAQQIITLTASDALYMTTNSIGPVSLMPSSNDEGDPLSDIRVRQAVSYAIDRDALIAARGFGILEAATQLVPSAWGAHLDSSYDVSYDPAKAADLLKEAGYPDGFSMKFYVMPNMVDSDMMVAVQEMLGKVGIKVELEFPDSGGYSNYRFGGWDGGCLVQHTRSLAQIGNTFGLYLDVKKDADTGEYSWTYMPDVWRPTEELYEAEQAASLAAEADDGLLREVHRIIMENLLVIPLYNIPDCFIMKNYVHDTGFADWGAGTIWLPSEAWISQD